MNPIWGWLPSKSKLLVVWGREPGDGLLSPVTLFAKASVDNLRANTETGVVLHWFCSLYPQQTAKDVAVSLLGQLLEKGIKDIHVPNKRPKVFTLKDIVDPLVKAIKQQLEKAPIVLIIDCISSYEEHGSDMQFLFDSLAPMAFQKVGKLFKIAVTSPATTDIAAKYAPKLIYQCPTVAAFTVLGEESNYARELPETVCGANT